MLAQLRQVNTRNKLNMSPRCGIWDLEAIATKTEDVFSPIPVSVVLTMAEGEEHWVDVTQLRRGSWQSSHDISSVASTLVSVYANVAMTEIQMAENLTVLPIRVSLERWEVEERSVFTRRGHWTSSAEAATISTPT